MPPVRIHPIMMLLAGLLVMASLAVLDRTFSKRAQPDLTDGFEAVGIGFERLSFADIDGWREDQHAQTLPVFVRSCVQMLARDGEAPMNPLEALGQGAPPGLSLYGLVSDWRAPCEAARDLADAADDEAARAFYEQHFAPIRILVRYHPKADGARVGGPVFAAEGRYTGYFEPLYDARSAPDARFNAPVLARPGDLVMVDLGRFRTELAGQRIAGSVIGGDLVPYPDHAAINTGALAGKADVLAYMDPDDLLFLQIQGSGRLRIEGAGELRVGYAGQNGHPYHPVGRTLIDDGAIAREAMSMQAIRDWLATAEPARARAVRESNASYVFFRILDALPEPELGPPGAQGVQLTPLRSLAVDRRYHGLGAPIFVTEVKNAPPPARALLRRLYIAQDTGGAIRGAVRGDIFTGAGPTAGELAGPLNAEAGMIVLLPVALADRLPASLR